MAADLSAVDQSLQSKPMMLLRAITAINTQCGAKSAEKTAKKSKRALGTKKAEKEITSARMRWSETDRMQLVSMVSDLNPCGISKWATLCNELNEWFETCQRQGSLH
jgi:hypothetical protein